MAMGRVVVSMTMKLCTYKTVLSCFLSHSMRQKRESGDVEVSENMYRTKTNPYCCNCVMIMLSN